MANDWSIIIGGTVFPFEGYGATVTGMSGVGYAPATTMMAEYALAPGGERQRAKVNPRQITVQAALKGTSIASLHHLRSHLIDVMRPDRTTPTQPVTLRYTGGSVPVEIDGYYDGGLEWNNPSGYTESLGMRFVCPDPFFRGTADVRGGTMAPSTKNDISKGVIEYTNSGWDNTIGLNVAGYTLFGQNSWDETMRFIRIVPTSSGTILLFARNGFFGVNSIYRWNNETSQWVGYAGTAGLLNETEVPWSTGMLVGEWHNNSAWGGICTNPVAGTPEVGIIRHDATTNTWSSAGTIQIFTGYGINMLNLKMKSTGGHLYLLGFPMRAKGGTDAPSPVLVLRNNTFGPLDPTIRFGSPSGVAPTTAAQSASDVLSGMTGELYVALGPRSDLNTIYSSAGTFQSSVMRWRVNNGTYTIDPSNAIGSVTTGYTYSLARSNTGDIFAGGATGVSVYNGYRWNTIGTFGVPIASLCYAGERLYISPSTISSTGFVTGYAPPQYYYRGEWYPLDITIPSGSPAGTYQTVVKQKSDGRILIFNMKYPYNAYTTLPLAGSAIVTGGAKVSPVITIRKGGSVKQVVNITTNDRLFLDNLMMTDTETITLDFAKRTYTSDQRGNLASYIRPGSNVANWSLMPGTNIVNISADGSASIDIRWRDKYWSLDT
jgi:hypothetical protein